MNNLTRLRMLGLATGTEMGIDRRSQGIVVTGFLPEWGTDLSQGDYNDRAQRVLRMQPISSAVTRAAFRFPEGSVGIDSEDGKLVLDTKGMVWYLFLNPGEISDEQIASKALQARMMVIQRLMNAENAKDEPWQEV